MTLAKSYHPELDPEMLAGGFPQFKVDGSEFTKEVYQAVVMETQHHACAIAWSIDLNTYQPDYDEHKRKISLQLPEPFELGSKKQNSAASSSSKAPSGSGILSMMAPPQVSARDASEEPLQALHQIFRPGGTGCGEADDEAQEPTQKKPEEPAQGQPMAMEIEIAAGENPANQIAGSQQDPTPEVCARLKNNDDSALRWLVITLPFV